MGLSKRSVAPEIQSQIETESAKMKAAGRLTEIKSTGLLHKLVCQFGADIEAGVPIGTAIKLAEILLRISGLAKKELPKPGREHCRIVVDLASPSI